MKCEECGVEIEIGGWPWCPHGSTLRHQPFKSFEVEYDGQKVTVDSLQAATKLERDSMARYRNGEKVQPMVFRAFHYNQDGKHYDCNSFGDGPAKPEKYAPYRSGELKE